MPLDQPDYTTNLLNLAAVICRPRDDIGLMLSAFAGRLQDSDRRVGGVVSAIGRSATAVPNRWS